METSIEVAKASDSVRIERLAEQLDGMRDKLSWKCRIRVLKFHDTDVSRILPTDCETAEHIAEALFNDNPDAVLRLEEIMLRRNDPRAAGLHGLKPRHLTDVFKINPDEVTEYEKNLLMYGGASCIWQCLKGNGSATPGGSLTIFDNTNAAIGVGDSSTAAAATQTDLQASSNKLRAAMDSTYPTHTDGTGSGAAVITFKSTFTTGQANFAWAESGVFNSATAATGRMLNRIVQSLGTKVSGSWSNVIAITLA